MYITRRIEFSASHLCANPALSEDENRAIYGEAANPHGRSEEHTSELQSR